MERKRKHEEDSSMGKEVKSNPMKRQTTFNTSIVPSMTDMLGLFEIEPALTDQSKNKEQVETQSTTNDNPSDIATGIAADNLNFINQ